MRKRGATKRYRGGGLGQSYTFGAPIIAGTDAGQTVVPQSSCMAEVRPGTIMNPGVGSGLPGMGGGGRRKKQTRRRYQRGGRYGFDLGSSATFGGLPGTSGIPQVMSIPCESARVNPLNATQMGGNYSTAYIAPTAGYTNTPSSWLGSTGAPSMLQTPYDARAMNSACLKTGGGRRRRSRRRKSQYKRRR